MNDTVTELPSLQNAAAEIIPAKRGRKSETPAERLERLQRAVADAKVAAKQADQRKHEAVGIAVLAEANTNPELKVQLLDILRRRVTGHQAKADIASLLRE